MPVRLILIIVFTLLPGLHLQAQITKIPMDTAYMNKKLYFYFNYRDSVHCKIKAFIGNTYYEPLIEKWGYNIAVRMNHYTDSLYFYNDTTYAAISMKHRLFFYNGNYRLNMIRYNTSFVYDHYLQIPVRYIPGQYAIVWTPDTFTYDTMRVYKRIQSLKKKYPMVRFERQPYRGDYNVYFPSSDAGERSSLLDSFANEGSIRYLSQFFYKSGQAEPTYLYGTLGMQYEHGHYNTLLDSSYRKYGFRFKYKQMGTIYYFTFPGRILDQRALQLYNLAQADPIFLDALTFDAYHPPDEWWPREPKALLIQPTLQWKMKKKK